MRPRCSSPILVTFVTAIAICSALLSPQGIRLPVPGVAGERVLAVPGTGTPPPKSGWQWTDISGSNSPNEDECYWLVFNPNANSTLCVGLNVTSANGPGSTPYLWTFASGEWTPLIPSSKGPACSEPIVPPVFDTSMNSLILLCSMVGGFASTWGFSDGNWGNLTAPIPNATNAPSWLLPSSAAYDPDISAIVLVASPPGYLGTYPSGARIWTWTFAEGGWKNVSESVGPAPPARTATSLAFDPQIGGLVLFGDIISVTGGVPTVNDTWTFTGSAWLNLTSGTTGAPPPVSPSSPDEIIMTYDNSSDFLLLAGGYYRGVGPPENQTWAYVPGSWEQLAPVFRPSPSAKNLLQDLVSMVFDARDGYVLAIQPVGGSEFGYPGPPDQVWRFGPQVPGNLPTISGVTISPENVSLGNAVTISVHVSGGIGPLSYAYSGLPLPCSSANRSSLVCTPGETGLFVLSVTVTDSQGNQAENETSFTVLYVQPSSSAPTFSGMDAISWAGAFALLGAGIASVPWYLALRSRTTHPARSEGAESPERRETR